MIHPYVDTRFVFVRERTTVKLDRCVSLHTVYYFGGVSVSYNTRPNKVLGKSIRPLIQRVLRERAYQDLISPGCPFKRVLKIPAFI